MNRSWEKWWANIKGTRTHCPSQVAQFIGALFCMPKGCRFASQSDHIPRLWVQSRVRACTGGNQRMFLSHFDFSLSHSLSLSPPSTLSKINKHILRWGLEKKSNNIYIISLKSMGGGLWRNKRQNVPILLKTSIYSSNRLNKTQGESTQRDP